MSDAISLFYQSLSLIVKWFFSAQVVSGVSLGWVFVSLIVFSYLVSNILNVPTKSTSFSFNSHDYYRQAKQSINRESARDNLGYGRKRK